MKRPAHRLIAPLALFLAAAPAVALVDGYLVKDNTSALRRRAPTAPTRK